MAPKWSPGTGADTVSPRLVWPGERVRGSTGVVLLAMRSGRLAELVAQRSLRPEGLDGAQMAVLYALSVTRPDHALVHGELCQLLAQTPSGVTRTVRRLERAGLVRRLADPDDGRATIVALTDDGRARVDAAMAAMLGAFEDVFSGAGVDDVTDLVDPLARLATLLADDAPLPPAGADARPGVGSSPNSAPDGPEPIGAVLRRARVDRGLTQRQLAAELGIGAPHLSKVESGKEQPSDALLGRAAAVLGLEPDELLLSAGVLPAWAARAAAADPSGALAALRRWAGEPHPH